MVDCSSRDEAKSEVVVDIDLGLVDGDDPWEAAGNRDVHVGSDTEGIIVGCVKAGEPEIAQRVVEALPLEDNRICVRIGLREVWLGWSEPVAPVAGGHLA